MNGAETVVLLSELRKRLGKSQAEVASAMRTTQSGVSRIERQPDIRVSTLDEYVSALGGRLRLVVEHTTGPIDVAVPSIVQSRAENGRKEYRVIWQNQSTRGFVHVGWLEYTGSKFVFSYTDDARSSEGFKPFPPFPLFGETYRSDELFPFFAMRLISAADPGFEVAIDALGLTRAEATPAELLARAPSETPHDTIQVLPEPTEQPDGTLIRRFLVSGVRHAHEQFPDGVSRALDQLAVGTELQLVPEGDNPSNPRALQLAAGTTVIGWVPDYLLDEIHTCIENGRDHKFEVDRANGPAAPWHLRVLCRLIVAPPPEEH